MLHIYIYDISSLRVKSYLYALIFFLWRCDPARVMASSFLRFSRSHTTTQHSRWDSSGRVISSSQRTLPDNTNTHNRQTSTPRVGFEPTISAGERPQTYALDRAATGNGLRPYISMQIIKAKCNWPTSIFVARGLLQFLEFLYRMTHGNLTSFEWVLLGR